MKKVYLLLVLFFLCIYSLSQSQSVLNSKATWSTNALKITPEDHISHVKITSTYKGRKAKVSQNYYDEQARIIKQENLSKKGIHSDFQYHSPSGKLIAWKEINPKISRTSGWKYEMTKSGKPLRKENFKNNKVSKVMVWKYDDNENPIKISRYMDNEKKLESYWENEYYSDGSKKTSTFHNGKGKLMKRWSYECKSEGEKLVAEKKLLQICHYEENDGKYLIKADEFFNAKGKLWRGIWKYTIEDTLLVEYNSLDENDELVGFRSFDLDYDRVLRTENFKNGKTVFLELNSYNEDGKLVKRERSWKGKPLTTWNYFYADGLLSKVNAINRKGKETSNISLDYILRK